MSDLRNLVRDVARDSGDVWATLAELGLSTIGVPEELGGSGGGAPELAEVAEVLGEHGVTVPFAEHTTAARALAEATGRIPGPGTVAVALVPDRLTVPWAARSSHLVVLTPGADAAVVDLRADGVVVVPGVDAAGRGLDDVTAPPAAVRPLPGADPDALLAGLALLRCASMVGACRAAYRLTREHVGTREQFGRPLVRLPAVATALARLRVEVLQAEIALAAALDAADGERALPAAALGRVVCGTAATEVARIAHQLHGAMGITREYGLHPLTRLLWAERDADLPEQHWAELLGGLVLDGGEDRLWCELTAGVAG